MKRLAGEYQGQVRVRLRPLRLRGLLCQPPLLHEAVGEWRARSGECGSCWSARRARRAKEALLKRGGRRKLQPSC